MSERKIRYALTHPQQRVWYTEKLYPGTGMWNNAGTLKLKGKLDYALLNEAVNLFIKENESIRLRIGLEGERPYQYVSEFRQRQFDVFDFSVRGAEQLYEWDSMQTQAPMPIVQSDLYYCALIKLDDNEGGLYAKFHHLISDALSIVEFSNQVMNSYEKLLNGEEITPTPTRSYIEYIEQEKQYLESRRFEYDHKYWTQRFDELPEPTVVKQKKTNYFSVKAERKVNLIGKEVSGRIRDYCQKNEISPFSLFLAALAIYINRISGKDDIIIGAPVANRTSNNIKGAFGMFVSTVPIRIKIKDELTFTEFAQVISGDWFAALKHQKYPYDMLIQELRRKHKGLESLYDITLSYQIGTLEKDVEQFTYEGRWHFSGYQANSLNIHVNDREQEGRLIVDYDHHVPFFSDKEIEYFHAHLINIVKDIISNPDKKLYNLELLADEERERILYRFNDTDSDFPECETLVDMWHRLMEQTPNEKTAVVFRDRTMSYGELDARSSALALLLKRHEVGPEDTVGLLITRTPEYFVSMLAVLKAGAAFLPIDTVLPDERISYMLQDSSSKALIASPGMMDRCSEIDIPHISTSAPVALADDPYIESTCRPENLAYVIYTSGSTGMPKGVQIEHHSIVHFMYMMKESWDYSPGAKMLCAASFCFDMSIMEALPALVFGAELILAAEDEANIPRNMVRLIRKSQANIMMVTPGRMELLLSDTQGAASLKDFREIGMGGDVLPEKLLAKVQQCTSARITNFYGPTEITVCATCADVTDAKVPNIGSPMQDVKAYILDTHRNPVPIGVPGELYVGGKGVSRGYINKPELNAERFIDNPYNPGTKLYRTGDLTRWYPLGEMEFLGRIDKQVKIRGYRIELAEIENRLLQLPGVVSCAVADYEDAAGRKFLTAFLVGEPPKVLDIKAFLLRVLPNYMVPSYFMTIDSLPFSASGKVDRSRLPDPLESIEAEREAFTPPKTATEKALAELWKNVLGVEQIDRSDSFFDIGGDSLSIVMVMARIPQQFQVEIMLEDVYKNPQLKSFAALIDAAEKCASKPIIKVQEQQDYPVSSAQQRMWILQQSDSDSTAYNIPMGFELLGDPDMGKLSDALGKLIERHDALRSLFIVRDGKLRQKVLESAEARIDVVQCSDSELDKTLRSLIKPYDMAKAPLMRAAVIETPARKVLLIDMHHSISDRRTAEVFLRDLTAIYGGLPLVRKDFEYKDYAVWQQDFLDSESAALQQGFWQNALSGELPLLNMHTDKPRPAEQRFRGRRLTFDISKQTQNKLRSFAQSKGATLFMSVLAVYNVLLAKYTGQEDIIVGTPVSGRSRQEVQDIAGVFINTLPLRNAPRAEISFELFFEELIQNTVAAFAHSDYPLERIISDIALPRDASRNPLFDTILVFSELPADFKLGETTCRFYPFDPKIAKLDLTLEVYESEDGMKCLFEYNTDLFKERTIKQISRHLARLFDILAGAPETRIRDVAMLTQDELWQVTRGFNQTDKPLDERSVQSLLEEHAQVQPEKTALICDKKRMSFAQLNNRANQIAHVLRENGVGRNTIVALNIRRSFDMVAGLFGILKAGGGYLPLDPTYPSDRVEFMLEDSDTKILLTDGTSENAFEGKTISIYDILDRGQSGNLERIDSSADAAYVIYTSGSTGVPKGATLPRLALYNLYEGTKDTIEYDKEQTSISVTTVSFDIFVIDCLMPLLFGCTVALCTEEELRQPHLTAALIEYADVKFIQTTPTRMKLMMDNDKFRQAASRHIEKIVLGGEEFPLSLLKLLKKHTKARIISGYGPTETTVYCTFKDLSHTSHITIGRPIVNTRMYILDKDRRPVPIGVMGEAYISGACVATGYINRDQLNKEKFAPDPYWPGQMMYQSGDICAFLEDGEMEIGGRVDHQVKIRGLRIELGEIEAAMREIDGVEEAVVKDWGEGAEKYLCAYYSPQDISEHSLRGILAEKLPAYMIPSYFVSMQSLPKTINVKVDRKALGEPDWTKISHKDASDKSMNMTERRMSKVWSEILGIGGIGPDDDFFELGGDSLAVINVQAALLQYGWTISTKDFYDEKTLRRICRCINAKQQRRTEGTLDSKLDVPVPEYSHFSPTELSNVLLTGATGYLGAYLLYGLTARQKTKVCCLVRREGEEDAEKRLRDNLAYYFGAPRASEIMAKTKVLCSDITQKNLGLDAEQIKIAKAAKTIIHSAALTDHIGQEEEFEKANVTGTKNVTGFAVKTGASLIHISTVSVSGTHFADESKQHSGKFDENSFYIGQNYADNVYAKSKLLAEEIVLDEIENGLNARIMRVGVLTSTMKGTFQRNTQRNAFANRILALCSIGSVPVGMLSTIIEMTPVDMCAKAVLALAEEKEPKNAIYHVFNTNTMSLSMLVSLLKQNGQSIEIISDEEFIDKMQELSRKGEYTHLASLLDDLLSYTKPPQITITANKTTQALSKIEFSWPVIDAAYMNLFLQSIEAKQEKGDKEA